MRRLLAGRGGRIGPGRNALVALGGAVAVMTLVALWAFGWARRSGDPARVLAVSARAVGTPVPLTAALDVMWAFTVGHAGSGGWRPPAGWDAPLPPPLCSGSPGASDLDGAVLGLERAISDGSISAIERRLEDLRALGDAGSGERARLRDYALARGHLAAGDPVTASQILTPVDGGPVAAGLAPVVGGEVARGLMARGRVEVGDAAFAVHMRYLAGLAALRRERPLDAITQLRFAVNGLTYLVPSSERDLGSARARRRTVDPGTRACGGRVSGPMDSMDVFAALVRAYLEADGFSDPTRLDDELARTTLQIDPGDPLGPVLARGAAGRLPQNLVWAASNLQRLDHQNRLRPDPRLDLARVLLVLRSSEALDTASACPMLERVAVPAGLPGPAVDAAEPARRALAAATLVALSRRAGTCGSMPVLDDSTRVGLLRWGGGGVAGGIPGRYEEMRGTLEQGLVPGQSDPAALSAVFEQADNDLARLRGGLRPPGMRTGADTEAAARAVAAWRRAVFSDVATAVAAGVDDAASWPGSAEGARGLLEAMNGTVALAGVRPADLYAPRQVARLARAGGPELVLSELVRYVALSYPALTVALLGSLLTGGVLLALLIHVSWWRYRLTTSQRFYLAETLERTRRESSDGDAP